MGVACGKPPAQALGVDVGIWSLERFRARIGLLVLPGQERVISHQVGISGREAEKWVLTGLGFSAW